MPGWTSAQLDRVAATKELEIATQRADGTWRSWVPIWVVRVDEELYVRTWYIRDTGWFGGAVATGCARVRVPGVEVTVTIDHIGGGSVGRRGAVDAAYRAKYGRWGGAKRMVSGDSAATTLRLVPSEQPAPD